MSVCSACLVSSAQRQYLVLRDVCHLKVLFHLGANQDPKPSVLEISCTHLSLVPLQDLIWQRSGKVNQFSLLLHTRSSVRPHLKE